MALGALANELFRCWERWRRLVLSLRFLRSLGEGARIARCCVNADELTASRAIRTTIPGHG
jgi:hypothetical protein